MTLSINGISIPDSALARDVTQLVRDTEFPLLFHHSSRVYYFGALAGKTSRPAVRSGTALHRSHVPRHGSHPQTQQRARAFSRSTAPMPRVISCGAAASRRRTSIRSVDSNCAAYDARDPATHASPSSATGDGRLEMDVLGFTYPEYGEDERAAVVRAHPRNEHFKEDIIQAFL